MTTFPNPTREQQMIFLKTLEIGTEFIPNYESDEPYKLVSDVSTAAVHKSATYNDKTLVVVVVKHGDKYWPISVSSLMSMERKFVPGWFQYECYGTCQALHQPEWRTSKPADGYVRVNITKAES